MLLLLLNYIPQENKIRNRTFDCTTEQCIPVFFIEFYYFRSINTKIMCVSTYLFCRKVYNSAYARQFQPLIIFESKSWITTTNKKEIMASRSAKRFFRGNETIRKANANDISASAIQYMLYRYHDINAYTELLEHIW